MACRSGEDFRPRPWKTGSLVFTRMPSKKPRPHETGTPAEASGLRQDSWPNSNGRSRESWPHLSNGRPTCAARASLNLGDFHTSSYTKRAKERYGLWLLLTADVSPAIGRRGYRALDNIWGTVSCTERASQLRSWWWLCHGCRQPKTS